MGRCNNRRAQQQAEALRNTPSRARFSKGPPNKKKSSGRGGGGRGRGGSGGRGGGSGGGSNGGRGSGGRGNSNNNTQKASVINKLSKRVEGNNKRTATTASSGGSRKSKHPLSGVDISKLDEIILSNESIQLVTKLLTDLNVMESTTTSTTSTSSEMSSLSPTSVPFTPSSSSATTTTAATTPTDDEATTTTTTNNTSNNNTTTKKRNVGGYTEYDDDIMDDDDDAAAADASIMNNTRQQYHWEEEEEDGGKEEDDDNDNDDDTEDDDNNNDDNDDDDDDDSDNNEDLVSMIRKKKPLFLHLTQQLSFTESHSLRACRAIENWSTSKGGAKPSNNNNSTDNNSTNNNGNNITTGGDDLALAMDWLCLHLTEEELTVGFKPNPNYNRQKQKQAMIGSGGILLAGTGRTKPIPHSSISIAKPITSDYEWRNQIKKQTITIKSLRLGFHYDEIQKAIDDEIETIDINNNTDSVILDDDIPLDCLLVLLRILEEKETTTTTTTSSQPTPPTTADLEFASMEREQEVEALEAIYDDQFQKINDYDYYVINVTPNEELAEPARSDECKLYVFVRPGYPTIQSPLLLFTNKTLPPSLLRTVNLKLIKEANNMIGEPCIFSLVDYISTNLHEMQINFLKEQRTKEMQAEQIRLRKEAGHIVDDNMDDIDTNNTNKLSRKQRTKLKNYEKAYNRHEIDEEHNKQRKQLETKRLKRIKQDEQVLRQTLANRKIQQRAQQQILDEAERCSRFAMNNAFNQGMSVEDARMAANKARKQCLMNNNCNTSIDENDDDDRKEKKDKDDDLSSSMNDEEKKDDEEEKKKMGIVNDETKETEEEETNNTHHGTQEEEQNAANDIQPNSSNATKKMTTTTANTTLSSSAATPTTMAFMDRLRQCYKNAAAEKKKREDTIQTVASASTSGGSSNNNNRNRNNKKSDEEYDSRPINSCYHLSTPKITTTATNTDDNNEQEEHHHQVVVTTTTTTTTKKQQRQQHHTPDPVPVPIGDLGNVMKDVIKTQTEQPWLVSPEARAPTTTFLEYHDNDNNNNNDDDDQLSPQEISKRNRINKSLRDELKRKYDDVEKFEKDHPSDFDHHSANNNNNKTNQGRGKKKTSNSSSNNNRNNTRGNSSSSSSGVLEHNNVQQFHKMLCQRRRLPTYVMKDEIVQMIGMNQITVISGDTGCGKTTQVCQLVLDDLIQSGRGADANIIVTQPRRISAIGVCERIASERCERVGDTAGYSIRLESKRSTKTRLLLCTTGILLRRLQCDPDLASVSHVFVDEVHERDINTDFLLIILKDLLARRRKSLKLILMSATLNAETFSAYFGGCPTVSIPGRTHPVKEFRLEDVLALTEYEVVEGSDYAQKTTTSSSSSDNNNTNNRPSPRFSKSALRKMYYPKYKTSVISSLAIVDETIINYELIASLLEHITLNEEDGAILVFLPGMMEIQKCIEELYKKEFFTDSSKVVVYPLHSSLSTLEQTSVFDIPPPGVRKIVVSTNIAETSITIEDVVYVVDSGRVKENRQDEVNQLPTLVECWVSRASAKQRRGRAGRVRPGIAYHMYSSHTFQHDMAEYQLPEMLRVGLEDLVLQLLILDLGEPSTFLSKAVNPPSALAMKNSLKLLEGLGAVECEWNSGNDDRKLSAAAVAVDSSDPSTTQPLCESLSVASELTALGFHLATLPVDPRVGKMMIYGALFGCIDPALTISASMSARNPFFSPFDRRDEADAARKEFATENSDHLTTLTAFNQWKKLRRSKGDKSVQSFLRESYLSRLTLFQMEDLRKQFADLLKDIGFLPKSFRINDNQSNSNNVNRRHGQGSRQYSTTSNPSNVNGDNIQLVKAVLCAGLYPNIIVAPRPLVPTNGVAGDKEAGEYAFQSLKGDVYLHPSTISFKEKKLHSRYCCYHELVKTSKIYIRDSTPVSEFALLLFGGSLQVYHTHGVITVDEWLKFRIAAKPATLVKHLRAQMESMLLKKILTPEEDVTGSVEGKALIQAVSALLEREKQIVPNDNSGAEIVRPWTGQNANRQGEGRNNNKRQGRGSSGGRSSFGGRGRGRGPPRN